MNTVLTRVLLLCYGNPGRLDDGLGATFSRKIEKFELPGVMVEADYQLTVEDAAQIAENDVVVFVDAAVNGQEPFSFQRIEPVPTISFTSHSIEPESLLALAKQLFGGETTGYALGIRGYKFNEFGEVLSAKASRNLKAAVTFLEPVLRKSSFTEAEMLMKKTVDNGGKNAER